MLRSALRCLGLAAILALPGTAAADDAALSSINRGFLEGYALPATEALVERTAELQPAISAVCEGTADAAEAREAFADTVKAWGRVAILRLPPLLDESRLERMLFHPDPRDVTGRQLSTLLAGEDVADLKGVAAKSVALKGIGTLDRLLQNLDEAYPCAYAAAVAGEVHAVAEEIVEAFAGPYREALLAPAPGAALYRDPGEATSAIVTGLATSVAALRDLVLQPTLGETPERSRWRLAPFRRSGLAWDYALAELAGFSDALKAMDLPETLPEDARYLARSLQFEIANAARALSSLDAPLEETVADEAARAQIDLAIIGLGALEPLLRDRVAEALGLRLGFNSLDGD